MRYLCRKIAFVLMALVGPLMTLPSLVEAHVSETSSLRIRVHESGVALDWNIDLATLHYLVPIDQNSDGIVSKIEFDSAAPKLEKLARETLILRFAGSDGSLGQARAPEWQGAIPEAGTREISSVHVNFHFDRAWETGPASLDFSCRLFEKIEARHSVITVVAQGQQQQQTVLSREYPSFVYDPELVGRLSAPDWREMLMLGLEHILGGTDHLLFLLVLLVAVERWTGMLGIVTAFTMAHSVTLGLAAFGVVRLPEKPVEIVIALSIAWVAFENLLKPQVRNRWLLTFGFGLIHGFGFAGALQSLDVPRESLLKSLLLFNAGVEGGQLLVVAPLMPLILKARQLPWFGYVRRAVSGMALLLACLWIIQRATG